MNIILSRASRSHVDFNYFEAFILRAFKKYVGTRNVKYC